MNPLATAVHEAGHALCALSLGLELRSATARPDRETAGKVVCTPPARDDSLAPADSYTVGVAHLLLAVFYVVGGQAERVLLGAVPAGCGGDEVLRATAFDVAFRECGVEGWQLRRTVEQEARRFVEVNREPIRRVACALLASPTRTLDGAAVRAALEGHRLVPVDVTAIEGAARFWMAKNRARAQAVAS